MTRSRAILFPAVVLLLIAAGAVAHFALGGETSDLVWDAALVLTGAPVVWKTIAAARRGHFATDIVASLAIIGAVVLMQPLAGLVIVLMQTGGEALEHWAEGRASAATVSPDTSRPARRCPSLGACRAVRYPGKRWPSGR